MDRIQYSLGETTVEQDDIKQQRDKRIGREIAFGVQQTLACWATDFIDPPVSKWFQNKYGNKNHAVTNEHVWYGEFVGDSAAFGAYMFVKRIFAKPVDAVIKHVKHTFDPTLTKLGKKSLKVWADEGHIAEGDPVYKQRLESYKNFQAENMVDTAIVATSATSLNVAAQKYLFHNGQNIKVILGSKLVGAAATISLMMGLRTAMPTTIKSLDDELSERYFSKVVKAFKKMAGVHYDDNSHGTVEVETVPEILGNLGQDMKDKLLHMVARHMNILGDKQDTKSLVAEEKKVLRALQVVLNPGGKFAEHFATLHQQISNKLYHQLSQQHDYVEAFVSKDVSVSSVNSILKNRVADLQQIERFLDRPDICMAVDHDRHDSRLYTHAIGVSAAKHEELVNSLLQPQQKQYGEPAVHIYANAKGQVIEHDTLAFCFNPEGTLAHVLTNELQKHLPGISREKIEAISKNYMADRQHAALMMVNACELDGDVVNDAIARSAALQAKYQTSPSYLSARAA